MITQTRLDLVLLDGTVLQVWAERTNGWSKHYSSGGGWVRDGNGGQIVKAQLPLPLRERAMKEGTAPEVIRLAPGKKTSSSASHRLPTIVPLPESRRK